ATDCANAETAGVTRHRTARQVGNFSIVKGCDRLDAAGNVAKTRAQHDRYARRNLDFCPYKIERALQFTGTLVDGLHIARTIASVKEVTVLVCLLCSLSACGKQSSVAKPVSAS